MGLAGRVARVERAAVGQSTLEGARRPAASLPLRLDGLDRQR
jgi:hypothetical protein